MKIVLLFLTIALSFTCLTKSSAKTKTKTISVMYYKNVFGNIHQNPSRYSTALTTVACGHPIKIIESKGDAKVWLKVKVGPHVGHIHKDFLTAKKPRCFQDKYPKFFDQFEMDLAELYYWAKLYDQYVLGKSKVR